jgi:hypothetical protein
MVYPAGPGGDDQANVQGALVRAWRGATVCLAEGEFRFDMELTIQQSGVRLKGQGTSCSATWR